MALISCPECGKPVSSTCSVCPHCGFAMPSQDGGEKKSAVEKETVVVKRAMASRGGIVGLCLGGIALGILLFVIFLVWGVSTLNVWLIVLGTLYFCFMIPTFIVSLAKGMHRSGANNINTRPVIVYDKNKGSFLATSLGKNDLYLTPAQAKSIKFIKNGLWGSDIRVVWYEKQLLGCCASSGENDLTEFLRSLDGVTDEEKALCKKN